MASATTYTGPSAREMFESHTLSKEIIARADDAEPVLDASELVLLKRYVTALESKTEILKELGCVDSDGTFLTSKAQGDEGFIGALDSAASYVILMHVARSVDEALSRKWAATSRRGYSSERGIQIIFFDGEEGFGRGWNDCDFFYGSKPSPIVKVS
ncbi:hypothetical protein IFR05_005142 [Cadophora sp. M221]|nr:hypothetical protein IFR05_005142 [Cadophora sp. M221]